MRACSRSADNSASSRPFWYWSRYSSVATSNASGSAFTRRMRRSSGDTQCVRYRLGCCEAGCTNAATVLPSGISGCRSVLLVAVADAVERLDIVEVVINRAELLADALDVAVDCPVVDVDVLAVCGVDQLVAALDHTRPRRERLDQQEFGHR